MYDNINEIDTEETEKPQKIYEFKEAPVKLFYIQDGMIETTEDGINLLTTLKREKLSILSLNGPLGSENSILANNIINKTSSGFNSEEKIEGIWTWGNPIKLDNGSEKEKK